MVSQDRRIVEQLLGAECDVGQWLRLASFFLRRSLAPFSKMIGEIEWMIGEV